MKFSEFYLLTILVKFDNNFLPIGLPWEIVFGVTIDNYIYSSWEM